TTTPFALTAGALARPLMPSPCVPLLRTLTSSVKPGAAAAPAAKRATNAETTTSTAVGLADMALAPSSCHAGCGTDPSGKSSRGIEVAKRSITPSPPPVRAARPRRPRDRPPRGGYGRRRDHLNLYGGGGGFGFADERTTGHNVMES